MKLEEFDIEPEELGDLVEWCKETGLGNIVGLLNAIATNRIIVLPHEPGLRTGDVVWVVEHDENGIADDYCGYVFLASTMNHVICSSQVNNYCDAEYILHYYEREVARDGYCSGLSVFPRDDCYESRDDAASAYESEF